MSDERHHHRKIHWTRSPSPDHHLIRTPQRHESTYDKPHGRYDEHIHRPLSRASATSRKRRRHKRSSSSSTEDSSDSSESSERYKHLKSSSRHTSSSLDKKKHKHKRKYESESSSDCSSDSSDSESSGYERYRAKKKKTHTHKEPKLTKHKKDAHKRKHSKDTKKSKTKKHKQKVDTKPEKKRTKTTKIVVGSTSLDGSKVPTQTPIVKTVTSSKSRGPMTREEYEKQQSVVRRVFDPDTGRHRLVKGDGEIIEEIVSKEQHRAINKQATIGDGLSFQSGLRKLM